jgi:6-pyruvoyltetrahydropterin/6-carboxytetrahydropterin synthase
MDLFFSFDFAAARSLPRLPASHRCSRLHGHTFHVELSIRGELGDESGWIVDFDDVDRAMTELKERLDHRLLNELPGLENPTTESLAQWLWDAIVRQFPGLYCVTVQEHPSRGVRYYGPGA